MPITRRMRSPASDSRSGRMSGMPPATDASNRRSTPAASGGLEQLLAGVREQLLVGGDDRLAGLQRGERSGCAPARCRRSPRRRRRRRDRRRPTSASSVSTPAARSTSRSLARSRTATRATSSRTPARRAITSALSASEAHERAPTLPQPRMPTRTVFHALIVARTAEPSRLQAHSSGVGVEPDEIVVGLAAHHDPRARRRGRTRPRAGGTLL